MSESEATAAVLAALTAGGAKPFALGDVPDPAPTLGYLEVTVSRRYDSGERRMTSETGRTSYRVTTRAVAKAADNARNQRRLAGALEYAALSIGGKASTPVQFESEEIIGPDDGWFSGLTVWTFTA